ncbi:aspartic peptidase domain-containing protein [Mycena rebaudengoi]|nr:aspartic peptidase domain-containing protein [Mycena rebaudengoi]
MQSTTWMLGLFPELSIVVFLLLGFFSDVSAAIPSHKHSPPRLSPFISIPLVKLHHPKHSMQLHDPAVVHKKHATHGSQRLALMSGRPKLDSALASLRKPSPRHSALRSPLHVRKRLRHVHVLETRGEVVRDAGASAGQTSQSEAGFNSADDTNTDSDSEVTKAQRPNCPHCAGLDIEANDIGYLATLRIGTPPQDFRLLVDSGSADMWVGGERCKSDAGGSCGRHKFLGPQSSSSFNNTGESWAVKYGSGSVSGDLVTDHVEFAGTTLKHHKFGIARNESSDFTPDIIPLDGMLGCAKSIISNQRTPSLVDSLFAARLIDQPITSYKISRLTDGKNDGEITLGGMDPSKYNASSLVRVRNINKRGFWEASLDAVRVNGKDLGLTNRSCIFDTGTVSLPRIQKCFSLTSTPRRYLSRPNRQVFTLEESRLC